jgi:hypothetical protein
VPFRNTMGWPSLGSAEWAGVAFIDLGSFVDGVLSNT